MADMHMPSTFNNPLRTIVRAGAVVFRRPGYVFIALGTTLVFIVLLVIISQIGFWSSVVRADFFSFGDRIVILWRSLGSFGSEVTGWGRVLLFAVALAGGINTALFIHYLKHRLAQVRAVSAGWWGMVLSIFGIGCTSCGSVLLSAIIGFGATSGLLGVLPLRGTEFTLIGLAAVLFSIWYLSRSIINPAVCRIRTISASPMTKDH